jgi:hypothetical protein
MKGIPWMKLAATLARSDQDERHPMDEARRDARPLGSG